MRITTFWKLIDQSRVAVTPAMDHEATIVEMLAALETEEIAAFARHFNACHVALDLHHVWLCCFLLSRGYASDDGFKDFRSDLISRGRQTFESALNDPDRLAELIPAGEFPSFETFAYTADFAYRRKTGREFDEDGIDVHSGGRRYAARPLRRPDGEPLTLQDAPRFLPGVHRRFMEDVRREVAEAKEQYASALPGQRRRALWDFYHFADHSKEAADVLHHAAADADESVRQEAAKYVGWFRERLGRG
jgi:hypothetical protein